MLTDIIGAVASGGLMPIFGALGGLVGGWLAKREQRKLLELTNSHEHRMADIDIRRDTLQYNHELLIADKNLEQSQAEGEIADDLRSADAFVESIKAEQHSHLGAFGNTIKSAIRPIITAALLWCTWMIYSELNTLVGGLEGLDPVMLQELFVYVVHAIIFLTITAVAWWFASRGDKAVKAIKGMMNG